MSAITVTFACGHTLGLSASGEAAVICPTCGEGRVRHTQARAPRFVGVATGPYAEHRDLEAVPVNLAPRGPMSLKVQES